MAAVNQWLKCLKVMQAQLALVYIFIGFRVCVIIIHGFFFSLLIFIFFSCCDKEYDNSSGGKSIYWLCYMFSLDLFFLVIFSLMLS